MSSSSPPVHLSSPQPARRASDSAVFLRGARAFTLQHPPVQQVEDVTRIEDLPDLSDADLGRTMALCSLPRSNPGNRLQYKRVNGP